MKIIVATRSDTEAKYAGGSAFHLKNMIAVLKEAGHFVVGAQCKNGQYDAPLGPQDVEGFSSLVSQLAADAIIADYSWMCSLFGEQLPLNILKICFVHDLRCRIIPCLEAIGYKDNRGWTEEKEAELLCRADILLVLNRDDEEFCKRMAPKSKTVRIGIAMASVVHDPEKEISGRCIYVGSRNMENNHAVKWFETDVWPLVLKEAPHASFDEVNGHPNNLEGRYSQAQIAVVPHIMNGGLKIKTAEAFAHGLPVVGNVCAFDGFGYAWGASDNPEVMAQKIIELLTNDNRRAYECAVSVDFCVSHMDQQNAYGHLLQMLK